MSIKKQYLKSKPECKVTFLLTKEVATNAKEVTLVGEFNDWDKEVTLMTKLKNGSFKTNINLSAGRDYQFRYLVDGKDWINDIEADKYVVNNFSNEDNFVISV